MKFHRIKRTINQKKYVITVAYEPSTLGIYPAYRVGLSFCSAADQESIKKGQMIAEGRFHNRPRTICATYKDRKPSLELSVLEYLNIGFPKHAGFLDTEHLPRWLPDFLAAPSYLQQRKEAL